MSHVLMQMERIGLANPLKSTSYALVRGALQLGWQVSQYDPSSLYVKNNAAYVANLYSLTLGADGEVTEQALLRDVPIESASILLIRNDPPYDMGYLTVCHMLRLVTKIPVINAVDALIDWPEKLSPLQFADVIPPSMIASDIPALLDFAHQHGRVVVKPLYAFGGESVASFYHDDRALAEYLRVLLKKYAAPVVMQAYIEAVAEGDARILLLNGEYFGSFNRIPPEDGKAANLSAGGMLAAHEMRPSDEVICRRIAPWLRENGIYFAGIDVIGGYLTEINITSPLGICQVDKLYGTNKAKEFWDKVAKDYRSLCKS